MELFLPTHRQRCPLGPGLEAAEIAAALEQLGQDPDIARVVLFGSRARGNARSDSDLDLPLLPVDLDLLISDAATTSRWAVSRWHVLGHIHREGVPLDAA